MTDYPVIDPADVRAVAEALSVCICPKEPGDIWRVVTPECPACGDSQAKAEAAVRALLVSRAPDPEPPALTADDLDRMSAFYASKAATHGGELMRLDVLRLIAALRQAWAQMDEANADGWGWKPRALAAERERDEAQAEALARRSQPEVKP